jgi:peptidoglycan/LPS O-acetylase OafA/YrhL
MNVLAVLAATAAAFVCSGIYYAATMSEGEQSPTWKLGLEVLRSLVLAAVVAGLAVRGDVDDVAGGLLLGLALWVGFPVVLWAGAMLHAHTPFKEAALHAGDWLAKLLVVGVIVSVWQ